MKNKIFATLLALTLALSLTACGSKSDDSAKADTTDDAQTEQPAEPQETVTLNVAASPTPHAEILKQCVPILAEQGIDLQIHEYSDYVVPIPPWRTAMRTPTTSSTSPIWMTSTPPAAPIW